MCAFTFVGAKGINVWFCVGDVVTEDGSLAGHAWCEGHDEHGWFLLESTNGTVIRGARPEDYRPTSFLQAGNCQWA